MSTHRVGRFVALVLAGLASCAAPPPPVPVTAVRAKLHGLTEQQVAACLGPPPLRITRGSVTLMSYPSSDSGYVPQPLDDPASATFRYAPLADDPLGPGLGIGDRGMEIGTLGVSEGPVAPAGCIVNVVLDSGVVRVVTFAGPSGALVRENEACSAIVRGCVSP